MRRLILSLPVLLAACTHTPALQSVPCAAPASLPAELSPPAEFPAAIQKLNDYLKTHSTPAAATPSG